MMLLVLKRSLLLPVILIFVPGLTVWQIPYVLIWEKMRSKRIPFIFFVEGEDRIKGLVWENDGYLLLYKRLEAGQFQWPRTESEVRSITEQQFRWLMEGLTTHPKKQVKRLKKAPDYTL